MIIKYLQSDFLNSRVRNVLARLFNKNTVGAYVLQADKGVFTFFVLPFLAYRIGFAAFGVFSTFLSLIFIAGVLVDWGFSQTAVRSMAIAKGDEKVIIASTVILARLILFLPVSLIVLMAFILIPPLDGSFFFFMFTLLTVFAYAISPVFLFQAEEKSFAIGSVTLAVRLITLFVISAFVTSSADLNLAFAIYALSILLGVASGWVILVRNFGFRINWPSRNEASILIVEGFDYSVANFGSTLYGNGSVFLLSLVCPDSQVGVFSLALAFTRGACSILTPVSQSYLPKISRLYEESFTRARCALRKALILQTLGASSLVVLASIALIYVVPAVIQSDLRGLPQLIAMLLPTIVATVVSSMLVLFVLIPFGMDRFYRNLVLGSALVGSACILLMGYFFQAYGAAASILFVEAVVFLVIVRHSKRALARRLG